MLKLNIIAVGKIKESYLLEGIRQFQKKLVPFCQLTFKTIPRSKIDSRLALEKEKKGLVKYLANSYNVVFALEGEPLSSHQFALFLNKLKNYRAKSINFIIGSSHGLASEISKQADYQIAFSRLTFPYQLFQLILCEQLYRGFQILHHGKYHK